MSLAKETLYPTLSCMLLPLSGDDILLPKSIVREVIYEPVVYANENYAEKDWLIGTIEWEGHAVPVVSFDRLCNQPRVGKPKTIRSVVCHMMTTASACSFYAIEVQAMPRPLILDSRALLEHESTMGKHSGFIAYHVKIGSKELIIPHFKKLEAALMAHAG